MKKISAIVLIFVVSALLTGCYTHLATDELQSSDNDYAYSDTTQDDSGNVTINNHYYLDDDYRQARFRLSFNYYYPSYSSWIGSYYHSYYDDWYWGFGWNPRPYPTWGNYYGYYPYYSSWVYYPYPYYPYRYDSWHPYYSPYWTWNSTTGYYPSAAQGRVRTEGQTRDINNGGRGERSQPIPSPKLGTPDAAVAPAAAAPSTRTRSVDVGTATGEVRSTRSGSRRDETPWWERQQQEERSRSRQVTGSQDNNGNSNSPNINNTTKRKPRQSNTSVNPGGMQKPNYTPPAENDNKNNAGRSRRSENNQPSYSAPRSSSPPPTYSPPSGSRGGNSRDGGSSSSGEGRRR